MPKRRKSSGCLPGLFNIIWQLVIFPFKATIWMISFPIRTASFLLKSNNSINAQKPRVIYPVAPGYVYLVKQKGNNLYKIGKTTDPYKRFGHLNTASPYGIEKIHVQPTNSMNELENRLHNKYHQKRVHGEWFVLNDNEVTRVISDMRTM